MGLMRYAVVNHFLAPRAHLLSFLLFLVIPAKAGIQACLHKLDTAGMTEVGKYDKEKEEGDGFPPARE